MPAELICSHGMFHREDARESLRTMYRKDIFFLITVSIRDMEEDEFPIAI